MARSFGLVDDKAAEAAFFLEKMEALDTGCAEFRWYFSAFVAAARSITFAMQAVLKNTAGFMKWYESKQEALRENSTAEFFHSVRTKSQHLGFNPVNLVALNTAGAHEFLVAMMKRLKEGSLGPRYFLTRSEPDLPEPPTPDAIEACQQYFALLLDLVYDCYNKFGTTVDAHQYFTSQNFAALGKTIEDAEEEAGFPRGWTDIGDPSASAIEHRWQAIRRTQVGCQIDHLFGEYLGKAVPKPDKIPPYSPQGNDAGN